MYVIERTDQGGGFVTPPGSPRSYTLELRKARTFFCAEDAKRELCPGNERAISVDDLLSKPR